MITNICTSIVILIMGIVVTACAIIAGTATWETIALGIVLTLTGIGILVQALVGINKIKKKALNK